ncbi:MAG TPA: DUF6252 family protein [Flavobacterium sp.]|jgi:hypothetical protein|nr:DUF6252 family protein [Flavobacterium sp.]HPJ10057.1 DUF6252 family protein [Flavobacterium sp.]
MNKLKSIGKILLLATVFVAASCSSDDDNNNNVPVVPSGNYFVKAKVDGADYANSPYVTPAATLNAGTLNIQSSTSTGNSIQIQIPNYTGEGTYLSGSNNPAYGYVNFTRLGPGFAFHAYTSVRGAGEVVVTSVTDTEIEGTFHAIAPENDEDSTDEVQITEGTFKLKKP